MNLQVMLPEQLGSYLKAIRLSQGLTQVQLAQRLGLSQSRIVEIEKKPGRIRVEQLLQVLHVLQTRLVLQDPRSNPPAQTPAEQGFASGSMASQIHEVLPPPFGAFAESAERHNDTDQQSPFTPNEGEW